MTTEPLPDIPGATLRRVTCLPDSLAGGTRVGPYSMAKPGMLLRVVPGVGRFLARAGCSLEYCADQGADPMAVQALLEGGVRGALVHQRGELPLHATTLVSPERTRALSIAGGSGAGKSTTAFELIRRGWVLLSEDLSRVTVENGRPLAWPGRSRLRLLEDACGRFGIDVASLQPVPNWPGKYALALERWEAPAPLAAVVAFESGENSLRLCAATGAAAVRVLAEQTYRLHYVPALGQSQRHLELVLSTTSWTSVVRAIGRAPVADVADSIEAFLAP